MGFLSGSVSYLRFKVDGGPVRSFTEEHLDRLQDRSAGRQRLASADGVEVGWAAGGHVLDTTFELEKNVVNDALLFDLRIDTDKVPADLQRAYYEVEVKALAAGNPSGFPSARQKREAKESARERLEDEARDGRFKKRRCTPVMWDGLANEVLLGPTSIAAVDRFCSLFEQTFQRGLTCQTAGPQALAAAVAGTSDRTRRLDDASPSAFAGPSQPDIAWIADETNRDFLGNEFLLWLWFVSATDTDTLKLADGSEATFMLARSLSLECPRGQTGHESFSHEGPSRLPEAFRAIQSGKLPRKVGLTLVRHDQQFEFTVQAEMLAVSGARLPPMPEDVTDARAKLEHRVTQVRDLRESLQLLYGAFLAKRLGAEWATELSRMQGWLHKSEGGRS